MTCSVNSNIILSHKLLVISKKDLRLEMYAVSGLGGASKDDLTHKVRPLIILAKFSRRYRTEGCGAGPILKRS